MSHISQPERLPTTHELDIKNILLLDDDVELADSLKSLLETRNFIVTAVANGAEGLREIIALDFDVIICDMMMPKLAGDMFYLAVERTKPELCDRFIFITGYADNPKVSQFLSKTKSQVLIKPVNIEDLIQAIGIVLRRTGGKDELRS